MRIVSYFRGALLYSFALSLTVGSILLSLLTEASIRNRSKKKKKNTSWGLSKHPKTIVIALLLGHPLVFLIGHDLSLSAYACMILRKTATLLSSENMIHCQIQNMRVIPDTKLCGEAAQLQMQRTLHIVAACIFPACTISGDAHTCHVYVVSIWTEHIPASLSLPEMLFIA